MRISMMLRAFVRGVGAWDVLWRVIALVFCLALPAAPAQAITLTFDDLSSGTAVSNGYGGLSTWYNFYALNTPTYQASGYVNGTVSSPNVLYDGGGGGAYVYNSTPFTFNSAYFTAAWNNGLNVAVYGYDNGTLVDSMNFTVNTYGPTRETFNW